ncbi:polysaccharide biosynthesis C-terminal domain-containing protein, partial [Shewanella amazonensis]
MNNIFYYSSTLVKALSSYLLVFIISNNYTSEELGVYFYYLAIASFLSVAIPLGINSYIERLSYSNKKAKYIFSFAFSLVFLSTVIFTLILSIFSIFYESGDIRLIIFVVGLLSFYKAIEILLEAVLIVLQKYKAIFVYWIVVLSLYFVLMCIFWTQDLIMKIETLITIISIFMVVVCILISRSTGALIFLDVSQSLFNKFKYVNLSFTWNMFFVSLLNTGIAVVDRIILGAMQSKEVLAIYSVCYMIVFSIHRFFSTPFCLKIAQSLYRSHDYRSYRQNVLSGLFYLLLFLSLIILTFYAYFFKIFSIDRPSIFFLLVLALSVIVFFIYTSLVTILKLKYMQDTILKVNIFVFLSNIILNLSLVPYFSLLGAAFSTLITYSLGLIYYSLV